MLALVVGSRVELRRAGVNSYFGLCPFHDERTRLVPRPPRREALSLLRLPGVGGSVRLRHGDRGAGLQGGAGDAGRPLRRQARDRGRGSRARRPAASGASACTRCSAGPPPTTRATCGRRARPSRARAYLLGRGLEEETLREFRVGYAPSAWDRMLRASRTLGVQRRGAARRRARPALQESSRPGL